MSRMMCYQLIPARTRYTPLLYMISHPLHASFPTSTNLINSKTFLQSLLLSHLQSYPTLPPQTLHRFTLPSFHSSLIVKIHSISSKCLGIHVRIERSGGRGRGADSQKARFFFLVSVECARESESLGKKKNKEREVKQKGNHRFFSSSDTHENFTTVLRGKNVDTPNEKKNINFVK